MRPSVLNKLVKGKSVRIKFRMDDAELTLGLRKIKKRVRKTLRRVS